MHRMDSIRLTCRFDKESQGDVLVELTCQPTYQYYQHDITA